MKLTARQVETANLKISPTNSLMVVVFTCWLIPTVKDTGVSNTVR